MEEQNIQTIAAFDFDGTISYNDTTLRFLHAIAGTWRTAAYLILHIPTVLLFSLGLLSRQHAKEKIFASFMKGKNVKELAKIGETFAVNGLKKCIRPEALKRIQWHQERNHHCVLISASLNLYLSPWAKNVGFETTLTSQLEENKKGIVSGKLKGLNCRCEEKVRRLEEAYGPLNQYRIYAYGDSRGDQELLAIADYPFFRTMP